VLLRQFRIIGIDTRQHLRRKILGHMAGVYSPGDGDHCEHRETGRQGEQRLDQGTLRKLCRMFARVSESGALAYRHRRERSRPAEKMSRRHDLFTRSARALLSFDKLCHSHRRFNVFACTETPYGPTLEAGIFSPSFQRKLMARSKRTAATDVTAPSDTDIARRAFELYCARGFEHGHHLQDWLDAERELREAIARDVQPRRTPRPRRIGPIPTAMSEPAAAGA
jgi:hypothetical protein